MTVRGGENEGVGPFPKHQSRGAFGQSAALRRHKLSRTFIAGLVAALVALIALANLV
jgi:uncharacterized protein involved in cysteine biosynthesis